jgi:hypothetical protein
MELIYIYEADSRSIWQSISTFHGIRRLLSVLTQVAIDPYPETGETTSYPFCRISWSQVRIVLQICHSLKFSNFKFCMSFLYLQNMLHDMPISFILIILIISVFVFLPLV